MSDPTPPLSVMEQLVFGADAARHPLGFIIEQGSGALPIEQQAQNYIRMIEYTEGREAAQALATKLAASERPFEIVKS